jgi:hypothetical protein
MLEALAINTNLKVHRSIGIIDGSNPIRPTIFQESSRTLAGPKYIFQALL